MRSTPARFAGATAALALVALPALAFGQQSSPTPAPAPTSPSTSPPPAVAPSPSSSSSGSSYTPRDGSSGGSSRSGYSSPSRGDYGGGHYDGPSRYAPGSPGRGGSGMPPTRVELPAPRAGQPGGGRATLPVAPGRALPDPVSPGRPSPDPTPPGRVPTGGQAGFGQPGFGAPGRTPYAPGIGRVEIPGVVGVPEKPGMTDVARDPQEGDEDTRLLPPPITPVIGGPPVGKPVPPSPQPPPATITPPPQPPRSDYYDQYYYWLMRSWGWGNRWSMGYYGYCYPRMMTEEDEYWARLRGYYDDYGYGNGCGYGYGSRYRSLGYWTPIGWDFPYYGGGYYMPSAYGFGYGLRSLYFLNLQPCAVVTAETYSGRRYTVVTMLPEFGAYGPTRLRQELQMRLKEDGEVTLHGRGSQELHLFDGFVRRVTTRWCGSGEW